MPLSSTDSSRHLQESFRVCAISLECQVCAFQWQQRGRREVCVLVIRSRAGIVNCDTVTHVMHFKLYRDTILETFSAVHCSVRIVETYC